VEDKFFLDSRKKFNRRAKIVDPEGFKRKQLNDYELKRRDGRTKRGTDLC
jgi:hypothetical protein